VRVYADADALAHAGAALVVERADQAIRAAGRFTIALSGGSTPRQLYARLASAEYRDRIDWSRVHLFWGDERAVAPTDAQSNFRMATEALLDHVAIAPAHVHRIQGEDDPGVAAHEYERVLRGLLGGNHGPAAAPRGLDLVLLGLGPDGHTASLFPHQSAAREHERWVVAEMVSAQVAWRVTLTPVVLNAAAAVVFLVSGLDKAAAVAAVIEGPARPDELPAQRIAPSSGHLLWLLDRAAASQLEQR
jgi:6-phosphogluconolactonase